MNDTKQLVKDLRDWAGHVTNQAVSGAADKIEAQQATIDSMAEALDFIDRTYSETFWIAQEAALAATKQQILRSKEERSRVAARRARDAMNNKSGFVAATEARND